MDPEKTYFTDDERWRAVLDRDPTADGRFLFAVTTTGVYCRPSCPARRPNRRNTVFYPSAEQAERDGYRPCRRCRPAETGKEADPIARACRIIENAEEPPPLKDLAARVGLSPFHFQKRFKREVGLSPKQYAAAHRARAMKKKLRNGTSVTDAIYEAGFGSSGRFYATSEWELGMTPTAFKKGGQGAEIRYAFGQSWLGPILAAVTPQGVCAIEFGETREELVGRLEERFPQATLSPAPPELAGWLDRLLTFIEQPRRGLDLPLDIRGTAFQRRVWQALTEIPPGATASYSEIAKALGQPRAARAVARACAANPIAAAVPCHRVVRNDGGLGGYRWGLARKQALLDRESAAPEAPPADD